MTTRNQLRAPDHLRIRDAMVLLCAVPCPPRRMDVVRAAQELGIVYDATAVRYAAVQLGVTVMTGTIEWNRSRLWLSWATEQDYRTARRKLDQVWRAYTKKNGARDVD